MRYLPTIVLLLLAHAALCQDKDGTKNGKDRATTISRVPVDPYGEKGNSAGSKGSNGGQGGSSKPTTGKPNKGAPIFETSPDKRSSSGGEPPPIIPIRR